MMMMMFVKEAETISKYFLGYRHYKNKQKKEILLILLNYI